MTARAPQIPPDVDPDESLFEAPPIAGLPYKDGSEEDIAIRRVIAETEAEAERRRREESP
jgi:hypothetical protein